MTRRRSDGCGGGEDIGEERLGEPGSEATDAVAGIGDNGAAAFFLDLPKNPIVLC